MHLRATSVLRLYAIAVIAIIPSTGGAAAPAERDTPPKIERAETSIAGWRILTDRRLTAGDHAALRENVERLLAANLNELVEIMPAETLAKLRTVAIVVDLDHGKLKSMQYHPSAGWLKANGYEAELEKKVHIPIAASYVDKHHRRVQPWCLLHELAHAYHDQVLSFENAEVLGAYDAAKQAGLYEQVMFIQGNNTKHYALTNHKEYFAELSEAYVGTNDFYPFVRGELKQYDPRAYAVMEKIWGKLP